MPDSKFMSTLKYPEKGIDTPKAESNVSHGNGDDFDNGTSTSVVAGSQALHRKLRGKEVQLFAIGGAIGTCMFNVLQSTECSAAVFVEILLNKSRLQLFSCKWARPYRKVARRASSLLS